MEVIPAGTQGSVSMTRQAILAVVVAAMLATAGCASQVDPGSNSAGEGSVTVLISDEPNAIDDFEHLNATIDKVGVHRVDDPETEKNESGWVEKDVDSVTMDLTELKGKKAAKLADVPVKNGTYDKVFVHVSEVNGTLTDGSNPDVKLPSNKLHIKQEFTVGDGEKTEFVFDLGVQKAGGSGKYVIKPVVSESGTDVEYEENPDAKKEGGKPDDAGNDDTETETQGKVNVYVSDEKNAIDQFAHLNVTITKVGLHKAGEESESEGESGDAEAESESEGEASGWVEKDVDSRTVDLTNYLGPEATKLTDMPVKNGTYDKVFVYVSDVNGTLKNGEQVNVKLPSKKLKLNKEFTVGNGEEVDFVYDISVFEAGKSGKYILKPVVSESGTSDDVEIEKKDEDEQDEGKESAKQAALDVSLDGNATAGENVTVTVTENGSAVANATVKANGEVVGQTDVNGTIVVSVPSDAEELELEVEHGDAEGELTVAVEAGASSESADESSTESESAALAAPAQ